MARLKTIKLPVSANLKLTLVAFAFLIVAGTLFYTNRLAEELKQSERKTVQLYAQIVETASNSPDGSTELSAMVYNVITVIDFPMIYTDPNREPVLIPDSTGKPSYKSYVKNVDLDENAPLEMQKKDLQNRIAEMSLVYEPIPIYFVADRDSTVLSYIFYDDSDLVKQIQLLPIVEIIIISMFILIGYISFSHIKRNEQSNIWVGMAKETAHQLGTPLSSLLGWIELLRYMPDDRDQVLEAADEMQRDVERLNKIALRFSKIGSQTEVRMVEMTGVLQNVIKYFERRLPHLGKKVTLTMEADEPVHVNINTDLFEWVFENLVRNAADAIDHPDGTIKLVLHKMRNAAVIDVIDNGRGIDPKVKKDIFRPGFSTKQRGWGLGLSLAKRIVEDYHGGKIVIKQTSSAGTTFRIRIPAIEPPPGDVKEPHAEEIMNDEL